MRGQAILCASGAAALLAAAGLPGCSESASTSIEAGAPAPSPPPPPVAVPPTPAPIDATGSAFETPESTARFLNQATFGASDDDVSSLVGASASDWFVDQLTIAPSLNLEITLAAIEEPDARDPDGDLSFETNQTPAELFWINAIAGEDQLRQRMAFALSQLLVISHAEGGNLFTVPFAVAYYQDILTQNAFGNYRDLLEEVTFSPAMGLYLTYLQNRKGDPATGRVPDENYAREIMQLFTIGLVELEPNGQPTLDAESNPIETYTNADVTGLARVFTGLSYDASVFVPRPGQFGPIAFSTPMRIFPEEHSPLEKSFLGETIPAGTDAASSIEQALDILVNHPNTPPFIARQLIQRFVTSNPTPNYVARVASAFANGAFTLPNGVEVGEGRRGDLTATLASILFDEEARSDEARAASDFGKPREPVIRFAHWARAFNAQTVTPDFTTTLWNTSPPDELGQHPYKSPSVFNFYRPGYVAPGTETGSAGLTVPEFQLVNAATISGYANFMSFFALSFAADNLAPPSSNSFIPDYSEEIALAEDPAALVDHLDVFLTNGELTDESRSTIIDVLEAVPLTDDSDPEFDGREERAELAVILVLTTPDYIVAR